MLGKPTPRPGCEPRKLLHRCLHILTLSRSAQLLQKNLDGCNIWSIAATLHVTISRPAGYGVITGTAADVARLYGNGQ